VAGPLFTKTGYRGNTLLAAASVVGMGLLILLLVPEPEPEPSTLLRARQGPLE